MFVTRFWTCRLPRELILYCDVCKNNQRWRFQEGSWSDGRVYFGREQELHCKYVCKNCERSDVYFAYYWDKAAKQSVGVFLKFGQYPPLQDFFKIEPQLEKILDSKDLKLFRQALICRSSNFGIAAARIFDA